MNKKEIKALAIAIFIPLAVGGFAAWITRGSMQDYQLLQKPPLSPPGWLFPIVWGILYVLMGVSSYLIAKSQDEWRTKALRVYALQLAVNFLWPILFFSLAWYLFSFLWLLFLLVLVAIMVIRFCEIRPVAGKLQIPYLFWCVFASYLNLGVWLLN
ncbi:MAG: tryptophan-rich sensory protein [Ruminococcaceae bacterium]|nr:tryptophan-rich sensory protein [Oscillospiraceae bacterium]